MTPAQKQQMIAAWNYCDIQDKSSEFMFVYMSDMSGVDYDDCVEFVIEYDRTEEDLKL